MENMAMNAIVEGDVEGQEEFKGRRRMIMRRLVI
jgi:hypothetical protein